MATTLLEGSAQSSASVEDRPSWFGKRRASRGGLAAQVWVPRPSVSTWLDFGASVQIMLRLLLVPDTLFAILSAIAGVLVFANKWGQGLSSNLSWTAVSLLLAFPLQNAIRSAYVRREHALRSLASFRSELVSVFIAHMDWDWPRSEGWNGRGVVQPEKPCFQPIAEDHVEQVHKLCHRILDALQALLLVPRSGYPRHECCPCSSAEKQAVDAAELQGRRQLLKIMRRLQLATEALKAAGMPANEANCINQYNMQMRKDFEQLWACKTYRTPVTLRAILRVLIQILPFFYGPYWAHIAAGDDKQLTDGGIVFACSFSCLISLLLLAMFGIAEHMENPFRPHASDTVMVEKEIRLCRICINDALEDKAARWQEEVSFDWEPVETRLSAQ